MLLGLVLLVALVTETSAASTSCQLRKHNDGKIIGRHTNITLFKCSQLSLKLILLKNSNKIGGNTT